MRKNWKLIACIIFVLVLIGLAISYPYTTKFERTITVSKVFQTINSEKHVYMVTDQKGNSYKIQDTIFYWHFKSTDLWTKLEQGKTYRIKAYGWRIAFISGYPNIIEATFLETDSGGGK